MPPLRRDILLIHGFFLIHRIILYYSKVKFSFDPFVLYLNSQILVTSTLSSLLLFTQLLRAFESSVGIPSFFTNLLLSFVVLMLEMLAKRNTHILSSWDRVLGREQPKTNFLEYTKNERFSKDMIDKTRNFGGWKTTSGWGWGWPSENCLEKTKYE